MKFQPAFVVPHNLQTNNFGSAYSKKPIHFLCMVSETCDCVDLCIAGILFFCINYLFE